jgi:hypothetical protein
MCHRRRRAACQTFVGSTAAIGGTWPVPADWRVDHCRILRHWACSLRSSNANTAASPISLSERAIANHRMHRLVRSWTYVAAAAAAAAGYLRKHLADEEGSCCCCWFSSCHTTDTRTWNNSGHGHNTGLMGRFQRWQGSQALPSGLGSSRPCNGELVN